MFNINSYLDYLINNYYMECDNIKKEQILNCIVNYYNVLLQIDFNSRKHLNDFNKKYKSFIKGKKVIKKCNNIYDDKEIDYDELLYIKDLLKYIKINNKNKYKDIFISEDKTLLEKYIKTNNKFFSFYKNIDADIIVDERISDGNLTKINDRYLFLLESYNIVTFLHEIFHMYNGYTYTKYYETPSILSELGLINEYNLTDIINRIDDIQKLKKINIKKINYDNYFYEIYCYGIASLISISYINKYGNNFNDLMKVINYIVNNKDISINKVFNYINMSDNEVIDNVNKYYKLSCYK